MKKIDLIGKKFGKLTVVSECDPYIGGIKSIRKRIKYLCKCDCGAMIEVLSVSLTSKNTLSCGCIRNDKSFDCERKIRNRKKATKEYRTWQRIKSRCYCKTDAKYYTYGARGIKVCDRWLNSYKNFLEDMGVRPENKHSIDRINNNGDYEPNNCRWATRKEQAQNKTTTVFIEINGIKMNMQQWCEKLCLKPKYVQKQLKYKHRRLQDIIKEKQITI